MASRTTRPNGHTWIFTKAANGKRRAVRLGILSEDEAVEAHRRLAKLESSHASGEPLDAITEAWLTSLTQKNYERVVATGLVAIDQSGVTKISEDHSLERLIGEWKGTLDVEPQTISGYEQHLEHLRRYFGPDRDVTTILPADADKFKAWVISDGRVNGDEPLSRSTVSRAIKTWRPLFEFSRRLRWVAESPFNHLRAGGEFNEERCYYITTRLVDKLIELCPDLELKAIMALSRYATFRGPSEFAKLTWQDVDLVAGDVRIVSPKTKRYRNGTSRITPLKGMALETLQALWDAAPEGATEVLPRLGKSDSSRLSQRIETLCRQVGTALWVKPFINLRASCETDWQKAGRSIFETAEWMGHSPEVALRHYNRIAKDRVVDLPAKHRPKAKRSAERRSSKSGAQGGAPRSAQ